MIQCCNCGKRLKVVEVTHDNRLKRTRLKCGSCNWGTTIHQSKNKHAYDRKRGKKGGK